jgi:hypothetical protein
MGATGSANATAELAKQNAVSNFLNAQFAAIRPQLSTFDRSVLDQHLSSLQAYETSQNQLLQMRSNPSAACGVPASGAKVPTDAGSQASGADIQFMSPFLMDTTAVAFNCNLTRTVTISFGYPGGGGAGGLRMPWLGFTDAQHGVSHNGGVAAQIAKYAAMNKWTISQVAYLMGQLQAVKTATGTLLDDTIIYFFNRHGDGNGHTNYALPNIICGGTGGYFKMGRVLVLPQTNPTSVLVSIGNAMGVPLTAYGTGPFVASAPMAGLT